MIPNADNHISIIGEQFLQQFQPRIHHAQPFIVARQVFSFFADHLAEPFPDFRVIYIVVVHPSFIACIVRRINVYYFHPPYIPGKECFQSFQIIAANHHIFTTIVRHVLAGFIKAVLPVQHTERHLLMIIDDLFLSYPFQCRHIDLHFLHIRLSHSLLSYYTCFSHGMKINS